MPELEPRHYHVCQDRVACSSAYSIDYLRRIKKNPENQGTGNLVNDLRHKLAELGIAGEVTPMSDCFGYCGSAPWVIINGELKPEVYWDKLDDLINGKLPNR